MLPNLKQTRLPEPDSTPNNYRPNYAIIFGSIAAIISVGYVYALYLNDPMLLLSGYENLNWLFFLIMMIMVGTRTRAAEADGFIDFKSLLSPMFKAFAMAYTLKYIFIYTLFTYIDPQLIDMVKDLGRKMLIDMRDPNWTDEMLQAQLESYNQQTVSIFDFMGLAIHLVFGFILALILAFILKRERPEF